MTAVLFGLALAVSPAQAPDDVATVYAELGRVKPAGAGAMLPAAYRSDRVTPDDIRKNSKTYLLRVAVLDAVEAYAFAAKLTALTELHHIQTSDKGKNEIEKVQEGLAAAILLLDEAGDELAHADAILPADPSKRWQAHHDFLAAAVEARIAWLEELNLAYGNVRSSRLPDRDEAAGQTGWRLVPSDKMLSKSAVRKMSESARERFAVVVKDHPGTPWAALAEAELAIKPGLAWEAAAVKLPEPPKPMVKKKK